MGKNDLNSLIINQSQLGRKYKLIGGGCEGDIYQYNSNIAFKKFLNYGGVNNHKKKYEKIKLLRYINDDSFCFPMGFVVDNKQNKLGYYMKNIKCNVQYSNFLELGLCNNNNFIIDCILSSSASLERIHKKGIIIGDIKDDNILINSDNKPIFVDTDNFEYKNHLYDLKPVRSVWLSRVYNRTFSKLDIDKYVFGMLTLQLLIKDTILELHQNDEYFKILINYLDVSSDIKDGLRLILSDANNKPYIGSVIKDLDIKDNILPLEYAHKLNYMCKRKKV